MGSVFIPFFLIIVAVKTERKKMGEKIKQIMAKYNLNISESENWGSTYWIGY